MKWLPLSGVVSVGESRIDPQELIRFRSGALPRWSMCMKIISRNRDFCTARLHHPRDRGASAIASLAARPLIADRHRAAGDSVAAIPIREEGMTKSLLRIQISFLTTVLRARVLAGRIKAPAATIW